MSFKDLADRMSGKFDTVGIAKTLTIAQEPNYIHSGNFMLNALLSGSPLKGLADNKTILFAGESGTGKSFLCMNLAANAQREGYNIIYIDTEGAIDNKALRGFGIDLDKVLLTKLTLVEEVKQFLVTFIDDVKKQRAKKDETKYMVILDSLGMLSTNSVIENALAGKEKVNMTKPKLIKEMILAINTILGNLSIPLLITNHIMVDIGSFIPQFSMPGGKTVYYAPDVILSLSRAKLKDDKTDPKSETGVIVSMNIQKSRFSPKGKKAKIHIHFTKGFNPYVGLHEYFSWENCGVAKGNILNEKNYNKLTVSQKAKVSEFEIDGELAYFMPKDTARKFIVKHLGEALTIQEILEDRADDVFTPELLDQLNAVIEPEFTFGDDSNSIIMEEFED